MRTHAQRGQSNGNQPTGNNNSNNGNNNGKLQQAKAS